MSESRRGNEDERHGSSRPDPRSQERADIDREVLRRTKNAKRNAWVLWVFLGGFNAHLAYLIPGRKGILILVFTTVAGVLTLGIVVVWIWCFNWIPLMMSSTFDRHRTLVQAEVEEAVLNP
ncbi:hypothetical protein [Aeromicrobium sp. CTD01-1L150]|uniref:hypothetical protein n=1 Tax=Aeromicrobium sp. CTD01-1L150 TaxID=3341830 RepID=UPI0035BFC394